MKKEIWDATFHRHRFPIFSCPRCGDGRVKFNSDSLRFLEPSYSELLHDDPDFEPGWDTVFFTCFFQCDDYMCGEIVTMIGDQVVYEDFDDESLRGGLFQFMRPRAVFPAPHIIRVTEKLSEEPKAHLVKSFELFWTDTGSCANKIRVFLESLLTQLQVSKNGSLAERITEYEKKSPGNQPLFDALRHVGNTASHDGQVERDALLQCYQILEHILDQVLDEKISNLLGLAAQLAKYKGKKPLL